MVTPDFVGQGLSHFTTLLPLAHPRFAWGVITFIKPNYITQNNLIYNRNKYLIYKTTEITFITTTTKLKGHERLLKEWHNEHWRNDAGP